MRRKESFSSEYGTKAVPYIKKEGGYTMIVFNKLFETLKKKVSANIFFMRRRVSADHRFTD